MFFFHLIEWPTVMTRDFLCFIFIDLFILGEWWSELLWALFKQQSKEDSFRLFSSRFFEQRIISDFLKKKRKLQQKRVTTRQIEVTAVLETRQDREPSILTTELIPFYLLSFNHEYRHTYIIFIEIWIRSEVLHFKRIAWFINRLKNRNTRGFSHATFFSLKLF